MSGLRCGDTFYAPVVRKGRDGLEVSLEDRTFRFRLEEAAPGMFVLRDGPRVTRFHLARDGSTVHLFWEGATYAFTEEREGARPEKRQAAGVLEAPMPGRVTAVKVAPPQRVRRGEELVVIEAMKMENALRAPHDGVVRAVHVAVGDMVAPGRALVEIEAVG
jgi:acetyl/propionyl-CoA carboxylase alpha subunit